MDTDGNQQEYRVLQVNVNGHTAGGTVARGRLATAVAGRRGQEIGQFTNLAGRGIDRGQGEGESFLHIVVRIFYHARALPAYKRQLRSLNFARHEISRHNKGFDPARPDKLQ